MTRPHVQFNIIVNPVAYVTSCPAKLAQEQKGLFGFHSFTTCPDCQIEQAGWEFWGENGHKQGSAPPDRHELAARLRYLASKQWRMGDGQIMGHHIELGGQLYYQTR